MSFVFGSSFQDENAENQGRRGKRVEPGVTTRNNAPKRAALGVITNQVRVQPRRAAKPTKGGVNDENAYPKQAKVFGQENQPFTIFEDNVQQKPAPKPANNGGKLKLTQSVTALPNRHEPISAANDVICIEDSVESPMVLDTTHEEIEEKKPLDRESIITMVPEYVEEIYAHLREAEARNRPKHNYMKKQSDITTSMRSILVDWLVEVSEEYKLHRETLFLAVNYIDRFLSYMSVQRGKLQLVGAASMFLASKYEEIYPPDVGEFAYITDDTYTKQQVLRMEHLVLKVLTFDVAVPTTNWFCDHFLTTCDADSKVKALAMFLAENTLIDAETFLKYIPSQIAAACVCLARFSLGHEPWPESLVKSSGYEVGHFVNCLKDLHKLYLNVDNSPQQAVVEKYRSTKYEEISNFQKYPPPASLPLM